MRNYVLSLVILATDSNACPSNKVIHMIWMMRKVLMMMMMCNINKCYKKVAWLKMVTKEANQLLITRNVKRATVSSTLAFALEIYSETAK